jgi:hypothetical protein
MNFKFVTLLWHTEETSARLEAWKLECCVFTNVPLPANEN